MWPSVSELRKGELGYSNRAVFSVHIRAAGRSQHFTQVLWENVKIWQGWTEIKNCLCKPLVSQRITWVKWPPVLKSNHTQSHIMHKRYLTSFNLILVTVLILQDKNCCKKLWCFTRCIFGDCISLNCIILVYLAIKMYFWLQ